MNAAELRPHCAALAGRLPEMQRHELRQLYAGRPSRWGWEHVRLMMGLHQVLPIYPVRPRGAGCPVCGPSTSGWTRLIGADRSLRACRVEEHGMWLEVDQRD